MSLIDLSNKKLSATFTVGFITMIVEADCTQNEPVPVWLHIPGCWNRLLISFDIRSRASRYMYPWYCRLHSVRIRRDSCCIRVLLCSLVRSLKVEMSHLFFTHLDDLINKIVVASHYQRVLYFGISIHVIIQMWHIEVMEDNCSHPENCVSYRQQ